MTPAEREAVAVYLHGIRNGGIAAVDDIKKEKIKKEVKQEESDISANIKREHAEKSTEDGARQKRRGHIGKVVGRLTIDLTVDENIIVLDD